MKQLKPSLSKDSYYRKVWYQMKDENTYVELGHVYHNDINNDQIRLSIKQKSKTVMLYDDSIPELLDFVISHYKMILDKDDNQIVADNRFDFILDFLQENPEIVDFLLLGGYIKDDILMANKLRERKKQLEVYSDMINSNPLEKEWQKWFSNNRWVFGSHYVAIMDRNIDSSNEVDFFIKSIDGFVNIVEIKRSGADVLVFDTGHMDYRPSSELNKAIAQCMHYIRVLNSNMDSIYQKKRIGPILNPSCLIVIGNSKEWDEEKHLTLRTINSTLHGITIVTYDQMLDQARSLLDWDECHLNKNELD
jgi:hypothetical protein